MKGKITLITPPDVFENETYSVLFIHLSDQDQEKVSAWLAESKLDLDINIYFYSGETDIAWVLHALSRCQYKYIDLDNLNEVSSAISGYVLGKRDTFYKTQNENISQVYRYINQNRIMNIESFLTKAFNDQIK